MAISPASYGSIRDATAADGRRLLLVGGGSHPVGRQAPASDRTHELRRWAESHLGVDGPPVAEWSAQDYTTHDRMPSIGRLPRPAHAYAATGFAKWGLTNGIAAALAIAARILDHPVPWEQTARHRMTGLASALRLAQQNATVGTQMITGWAHTLRPSEGREGLRHDSTDSECSLTGVCTHLGGILRWNDVEETWDCPLHGSRFAADGAVLEDPQPVHSERRPGSSELEQTPAMTDHQDPDQLDRNWAELLQELRVAQTGVQILTAFLLTVPFAPGFDRPG